MSLVRKTRGRCMVWTLQSARLLVQLCYPQHRLPITESNRAAAGLANPSLWEELGRGGGRRAGLFLVQG